MIINVQHEKPKFVVFDGLDNTGKTTLIERVKKEFEKNYNCNLVHFPSDELVKKYFNSEKQIKNQRKEFIDALLDEVNKYFSSVSKNDIYFIDRAIISSLLYQGNPEDIGDEINYYIERKYFEFFNKFDISMFDDILYFIFMQPFVKTDRIVSDKNKELFDNKESIYLDKIYKLYSNIILGRYDLLSSDNVIDCSLIIRDKDVNVEMDKTQELRKKLVTDKISSYFSLII